MKDFPKLSQFQHDWCTQILDEIDKIPISVFFDKTKSAYERFHSTKEFSTNTSDPIDLSEIRNRLQEGKYDTVLAFGYDLRQVFYNSLNFFSAGDPIYLMAQELQNWFEKRFMTFPRSSQEQWLMKLRQTKKLINKMIKNAPSMDPPKIIKTDSSSTNKTAS